MTRQLLTRDQFREQVFIRDGYRCVVCGSQAKDAHHITERRLWSDGGYYLDNGASVCGPCHIECERTNISTQTLRDLAKIRSVELPEQEYPDQIYDKWGNPVLEDGRRLRGELFDDESIQKVIADHLAKFTPYVKYPRTYHLPWSPGATKDDRVMADTKAFWGKDVVVTAKMDGENVTMYSDYMHARSLEYESHESRNRVKALWAGICADIPEGWRVCGENMYAKHAIAYSDLPGYFLVHSIWNERNIALSWEDTLQWAELVGLPTVPPLLGARYDEEMIRSLPVSAIYSEEGEGYVVRVIDEIAYKDWPTKVGKFVRANHVAEHGGHWKRQVVTPNTLLSQNT